MFRSYNRLNGSVCIFSLMGGLPVVATRTGRDSDRDATGALADTVVCTSLSWINDFGVSDLAGAEYSQQISYH
jgi:hypothetical protein